MSQLRPSSRFAFFFLLGAFVVLATVVFYTPAEAQRTGPYMLVAHSNETANVGLFRINQSSGATSFCFVEGAGSGITIRCTPEVQ